MLHLSMTQAIFRGFQEHLIDIIQFLPASISPNIKQGLLDTYWKLSNYYYKYDQSPFYTWLACEFCYYHCV